MPFAKELMKIIGASLLSGQPFNVYTGEFWAGLHGQEYADENPQSELDNIDFLGYSRKQVFFEESLDGTYPPYWSNSNDLIWTPLNFWGRISSVVIYNSQVGGLALFHQDTTSPNRETTVDFPFKILAGGYKIYSKY